MLRSHRSRFGIVAVLVLFYAPAPAAAQFAASADEAVDDLRRLFHLQDFEAGDSLGAAYASRFSAARVQAWHLLNRAENGERAAAVEAAEQMVTASPEDVWSHFALAGALNDYNQPDERVLEIADRVHAMAPEEPDVLWLMANVLNEQGRKLDAVAFVDEHLDSVEEPGPLLLEKAFSLYYLPEPEQTDHEAEIEAALDALRQAREVQPDFVPAYMIAGLFLNQTGRADEAFPLLAHAVRNGGHARYGNEFVGLIERHPELSADEKKAEIREVVQSVLAAGTPSVVLLSTMAGWYSRFDMAEEERALDDRVLALAPASRSAEWVLTKRMRAFSRDNQEALSNGDPSVRAAYAQQLWNFVRRPEPQHTQLYGEAYINLFGLARSDSLVDPPTFLAIVEGMAANDETNLHVSHAAGARALSEKTTYFREAEALARKGLVLAREQLAERNYASPEDRDEAEAWYSGMMTGALGWVFFNEGRLEDAEPLLLDAADKAPDEQNLFQVGRLYEAMGAEAPEAERMALLEEAESFYVKGAMLSTPGENPNDEALHRVYVARTGSADGYEAFLADLEEIDRANRKREILAGRQADPELLPAFTLERLNGEVLDAGELAGDVVVINFWGVWCGWCIKEMPDLQQLSLAYRNDPDVHILTINNDANPEEARAYMSSEAFDFDVLLDDGYVTASEIHAFPTTWFVGRDGRIAFEKVGWTEKLVEEFTWRIEALRGPSDGHD